MKHEVDLSIYKIRTDLLIDEVNDISKTIVEQQNRIENDININTTIVKEDTDIKRKGIYTTISFEDITDINNYKNVEKVFKEELSRIINNINLNKDYKTLIIGLGNRNSTPDSLGVKVCDNIITTRHIALLSELGEEYRIVSSFTPDVMGNTGIEAQDIIKGLIKEVEFDLIIVVDALASSNIERLNKTIQLTDSGISPGSGVGNYRKELSKEVLGIPVIAIGVPTVVDASTIVTDTFNLLIKKLEYMKNNDSKEKLKVKEQVNYLKEKRNKLNKEEKNNLLGLLGNLKEEELKILIDEILTPVGYNMMVTPKEIDFIIDKLSLLISKGINTTIHNIKI